MRFNTMIIKFSLVSLAISLAGCSSMKVEDADMGGLPPDFDIATYSEINPDIALYQIKLAVVALNKPTLDSLKLPIGTDPGTVTTEKKDAIRAAIGADSANFFTDTSFIKTVFTQYTGLSSTLWDGFDSLAAHADRVGLVRAFNVYGKSVAQDKQFLSSFVFDSSLIARQYEIGGFAEGRPYKYCETGSNVHQNASDSTQAAVVDSARGIVDFRPNTYCLKKADKKVYLNK